MSATNHKDLKGHIGHKISCVSYGKNYENVAVECKTCMEVLMDYDKPKAKVYTAKVSPFAPGSFVGYNISSDNTDVKKLLQGNYDITNQEVLDKEFNVVSNGIAFIPSFTKKVIKIEFTRYRNKITITNILKK